VTELRKGCIGDVQEQDGTNGTTPGMNVLGLPAVCRMTGLRRSTIYRMQASGQFPRRVRIGARAVGWIEREVQEWLATRAVATR